MPRDRSAIYGRILERVFETRYRSGQVEVPFERTDLSDVARELGVSLPKNLGDVLYSARYRGTLPAAIAARAPQDHEWVIEGRGRARYAFVATRFARIRPNEQLLVVKIPDATPQIVLANAKGDEQALLARLRYNRLIDLFLGLTAYSLQGHLRTTLASVGQIEIDELYVGVDRAGRQFLIPVQAKGGSDELSTVQSKQDAMWCKATSPELICIPVAAQFMDEDRIALFELGYFEGQMSLVNERHYRLVPAAGVSTEDLVTYSRTFRES